MDICSQEEHSAELPSFLQEEAGFPTTTQGGRSRSFPGTQEPEARCKSISTRWPLFWDFNAYIGYL